LSQNCKLRMQPKYDSDIYIGTVIKAVLSIEAIKKSILFIYFALFSIYDDTISFLIQNIINSIY